MAKWGDKWAGKKGAKQNGLETPDEPHVNGEPGNQNDKRLAMLEAIADNADDQRKESLVDVTTESYNDLPGTMETIEQQAAEAKSEEAEETEETQEAAEETEQQEASAPVEAKKFKIKVNGNEQEVTEEELIARAQKVSAADQYLTEAAKLYAEAAKNSTKPSAEDVSRVEEDDLALARAIQMGSEEEAVKAIKSLKGSQRLSTDDVSKIIDSRFDQRMQFQRDLSKFTEEYKDLLANPDAKAMVFELDESYHLKGESPGYNRFKKAADAVGKIFKGTQSNTTMSDKEQRKASVKVVTGSGARQPAPAEEKEPTTQDVIRDMAKRRGQFIQSAGN